MSNLKKFILLSFLMLIIFIFTFIRSIADLRSMLYLLTSDNSILAMIIHGIFLILFIPGIIIKKARNVLFSALLLILSGTAAVISIIYLIPPNIIIFVTFFFLIIIAIIKKELDFDFEKSTLVSKVIGIIALICSFYYLHWIEEPIFVNALLYSPLAIINCPTMLAISGLLCFLKKPGSLMLEYFVAGVMLYFGFFGIMRFGAYIDISLVITAMYLIVRLSSKLNYEKNF